MEVMDRTDGSFVITLYSTDLQWTQMHERRFRLFSKISRIADGVDLSTIGITKPSEIAIYLS